VLLINMYFVTVQSHTHTHTHISLQYTTLQLF